MAVHHQQSSKQRSMMLIGTCLSLSEEPQTSVSPGNTGTMLIRHVYTYLKARHCDPSVGRFVSMDSIAYVGGVNLREYVGYWPTTFLDPYGLIKQQITMPPPPLPLSEIPYGNCTFTCIASLLGGAISPCQMCAIVSPEAPKCVLPRTIAFGLVLFCSLACRNSEKCKRNLFTNILQIQLTLIQLNRLRLICLCPGNKIVHLAQDGISYVSNR